MFRIGVVSFLNSRPLIAGLDDNPGLKLVLDVPARLPARLAAGEVDVALVPIIDVLRSPDRYRVISDACIGCDGETMTVRIFSQVPPDRIRTLHVDGDSHTSIALARILWHELYDRALTLEPLDREKHKLSDLESVLLIGDKVVDPARTGFGYEVDLGGAWKAHTGLPFVFAVWVHKQDCGAGLQPVIQASLGTDRIPRDQVAAWLMQARDRGVADAARIAADCGPELGWTIPAAERYLTRCLSYKLDPRACEGAELFARLAARKGIAPLDAAIDWPPEIQRKAPSPA